MKKRSYSINIGAVLTLIIIACTFTACKKKEATLTASETPEKNWAIPQGDHDYDERIMAYFKRFGVYTLYKFELADFIWRPGGTAASNYKPIQADEAYVNKQLDLLDQHFFKYYQDSTLRKYMPIKLFLCSSLRYGTVTKEINCLLVSPTDATTIGVIDLGSYQSFAVNWGRKAVLNIKSTIDSTVIFKNDVNFAFLKMADINTLLPKSVDFITTSDYTTALVATTVAERYKRGFIGAAGAIPSVNVDYYTYLRAITSTSYTDLTNPTTVATDATFKGILNPLKDVNGLIKKKYNFMIDHYKIKYNIDLQRIGNGE